MQLTRQVKVPKNELLDELAHEAGIVYSQTLVYFRRILRKKNIWLSKKSIQKLVRNTNLHSQTVQGITDIFYDNLASWRELRKTDPNARMPKRRKWYFVLPYKSSAIKLKDNKLILSNGRGNAPLVFDWAFEKPDFVRISFDGKSYVVNAVYTVEAPEVPQTGGIAGIDLGEIHLAVANTGEQTVIINGRELRSKRRYQNKIIGRFQQRLSKHKKGSRKYKQLNRKKKQVLRRIDNQINDILHKQTTKLVCTLKENGVKTAAIGDVRNIRKDKDNDKGRHANQKLHQMPSGQVRAMIEYKCAKNGIETVVIDEAYSTQTCPKCLKRYKPSNRNYKCRFCGFEYHRDGVGAINIRQKQMYREYAPVVGAMTPPVGIHYRV
jgi:putative transposase